MTGNEKAAMLSPKVWGNLLDSTVTKRSSTLVVLACHCVPLSSKHSMAPYAADTFGLLVDVV